MAANSSLNLSSLDFDTLKQNFKDFLKSQSSLKDYNYDGSNINVLLDVMTYNSYLNSFYLNMIASEMFLDSAQKYDSIVSHAKELNYIPNSYRAAIANVNIVLETTGIGNVTGKLTVPKGTRFFGTNSNGSFQFVTDQVQVYTSSNNTFTVSELRVNEGTYSQDSFVMNYDIENQRFILSNENIDVNSITVNVIENYGQTNTVFVNVPTLYGLSGVSNVYFIQATQTGKYEISFGDGNFGRKPLDNSTILVNYIVTNGSDGNGIEQLTLSDDLGTINGGEINSVTVTVSASSARGANQESIESVRFNAPRYFATQQRAVASDDYASLVKSKFGGQIADVSIFGGETLPEKKYGRVIVCLKPSYGIIAPDYIKNEVSKYLIDYIALPNRVEITDPEYLFVKIDTTVQYDQYSTVKTTSDLKTTVLTTIQNYSSNNLEKFGNDLRYSRLVSDIDNSDTSFVSNQTDFRIIKRISPKINFKTSYSIELGTYNPLYREAEPITSSQHINFHGSEYATHFAHAALISSRFTFNSSDGFSYPISYMEDDGNGNIDVYAPINNVLNRIETIGTIDYTNGSFKLTNISISDYNEYVSIYLRPYYKDIFSSDNKIVLIDANDVNISIIEKRN